jgi:hypothetical protein
MGISHVFVRFTFRIFAPNNPYFCSFLRSCHFMSFHVISCHIMSCPIMSCRQGEGQVRDRVNYVFLGLRRQLSGQRAISCAISCPICCKLQMRFGVSTIWCPTRNCHRLHVACDIVLRFAVRLQNGHGTADTKSH